MHFYAILPFALLLWWPVQRPFPALLMVEGPLPTLSVVVGQILLLLTVALILGHRLVARVDRDPSRLVRAQATYHSWTLVLRIFVLLTLAVDLFCTQWPECVRSAALLGNSWALDELIILSPFFVSMILGWAALYRTDARLRDLARRQNGSHARGDGEHTHWTLTQYLVFNLRHQLLIVAIPMTILMLVFDRTRGMESWISVSALSVTAATVFLLAPLLLRYIWSTERLPDGPLRSRLENLSARINLGFRDILVWRSGGMVVNAAVMGLLGPLRYVLLSDAMLTSMTENQINAVFGHEAGHVKHRHIQFFVLFGILGTLIVSGIMEVALRWGDRAAVLNLDEVSLIGFAGTVLVWGVGFGWISRRFERQADLFGARCATPPREDCRQPCSVHDPGHAPPGDTYRVCASGAQMFVSALDRVSVLNGIPKQERSWRHSSIASRIALLSRLAGDPAGARRFQRRIVAIKWSMVVGCLLGLLIAGVYVYRSPVYRELLEENLPSSFLGDGQPPASTLSAPGGG